MKSGSNLEKVLAAGHFAFTGELGPPRGTTAEEVREKCEHLKGMVDSVKTTRLPLSVWQAGLPV